MLREADRGRREAHRSRRVRRAGSLQGKATPERSAVGTRVTFVRVDLASGTEFAGYRIERTSGEAAGWCVPRRARATQAEGRPEGARPELAVDERFRERFIRELELAASLDQPNVLPVYDAGEQNGDLFIAMRYVDGADLRELIDESPLSVDDVLTVLADVARALDAAHSKGSSTGT